MNTKQFLKKLSDSFPDDRITSQKKVPTFHPESAVEAAQLFELANEYGHRLFIAGFGNNIIPVGAKFASVLAVQSDRLNRMIEIITQDYYFRVGAGYPLKEINEQLKEQGLFFPHADLPYVGSVGGALAVGLAARQDKHLLPIGRYFIQAEIVTPEGNIIRPGSACFKSVSGFDIVKIYSPSWGILGMIMTATFRALPLTMKNEFENLIMQPIEYEKFADVYSNPGDNQSAIYSKKIKDKFDPNGVLPLMGVE
jgi:FAD/FMN-containing dehydrogenase